VVKEIPFSVDQVGQMLLQAALFHAEVDRLPNVQKVSTVSHLLLVMKWIRFTVGQILMMPVVTVISHVNQATVTFALMVKGASHIHFATRLARRQCLHLL